MIVFFIYTLHYLLIRVDVLKISKTNQNGCERKTSFIFKKWKCIIKEYNCKLKFNQKLKNDNYQNGVFDRSRTKLKEKTFFEEPISETPILNTPFQPNTPKSISLSSKNIYLLNL
jgi:hypothetical protein